MDVSVGLDDHRVLMYERLLKEQERRFETEIRLARARMVGQPLSSPSPRKLVPVVSEEAIALAILAGCSNALDALGISDARTRRSSEAIRHQLAKRLPHHEQVGVRVASRVYEFGAEKLGLGSRLDVDVSEHVERHLRQVPSRIAHGVAGRAVASELWEAVVRSSVDGGGRLEGAWRSWVKTLVDEGYLRYVPSAQSVRSALLLLDRLSPVIERGHRRGHWIVHRDWLRTFPAEFLDSIIEIEQRGV